MAQANLKWRLTPRKKCRGKEKTAPEYHQPGKAQIYNYAITKHSNCQAKQ